MPIDCLNELLDDVRKRQPPVYLADERMAWLAEVGQVISALPTQSQRWAATTLVANDLAVPGMPLKIAYQVVLEAVMRTGRKP